MPTIGTFHTLYWAVTGGAGPPPPGPADRPQYPPWQASISAKTSGG